MSDITMIKDRIRKLMAYANDGAASEAEIENAMGHAARLIDAHHLSASEFESKSQVEEDDRMGKHVGHMKSAKIHAWENILASAICELFGSVKYYIDSTLYMQRVNGIVQLYPDGNTKKPGRFTSTGRCSNQLRRRSCTPTGTSCSSRWA